MILDHLIITMILARIYTFSIYDVKKILESAQPIKGEFKFPENNSGGIYGYALVLTKKLVSISSDGQRHFEIDYIYFFHNTILLFYC